jgi:hypothetical protein
MVLRSPPHWTDDELNTDRLKSIRNFIEARQAAVRPLYDQRLTANMRQALALFRATDNLLSLRDGSAFAKEPALTAIARYLAGPPVSEDDFDTLAGQKIAKRRTLPGDLAKAASELLEDVLDRRRVPWLYEIPPRQPTATERKVALAWTAALKTSQEVATTLRGKSSKAQEAEVRAVLNGAGYRGATGNDINLVDDLDRGTFRVAETRVAGAKCDVPVRLYDGRLLLIECKVSNSSTNSVKRLNRETGEKAARWRQAFGTASITAAVLAGVYRLTNLKSAQAAGITIIWQHGLGPLAEFARYAVRS